MKKKIFTLMVSAAFFAANPAFGMSGDLEESNLINHKPVSQQRDIEENNANPKTWSWRDFVNLPVTFVTSLFEPFTNENAQEFYKSQITQVKNEGPLNYAYNKAGQCLTTIKNHPTDVLTMGTTVALGWTLVGEYSPVIPLAVGAVNNAKFSKTLYKFAESIPSKTILDKSLKIALYGGAVYCVGSMPVAAALDWNSLADAQAYYKPGTCPDATGNPLISVKACLETGQSLATCRSQISDDPSLSSDLYVFTRHPSPDEQLSPVSIVRLDKGETCFLTALTPDSPVTKTCFPDLNNPGTRTVEIAKDMTLLKAHEGLTPGQSVQHAAIHNSFHSCAHFHKVSTKYDLGNQPKCLLTALKSGGDVTQVCFDPENPESLVLKKAEDVSLIFEDNGRPFSIVIKNPQEMGLNLNPEQKVDAIPKSHQIESNEKPIGDGNECYVMQKVKVPCDATCSIQGSK